MIPCDALKKNKYFDTRYNFPVFDTFICDTENISVDGRRGKKYIYICKITF